jgi:hypothetical protein
MPFIISGAVKSERTRVGRRHQGGAEADISAIQADVRRTYRKCPRVSGITSAPIASTTNEAEPKQITDMGKPSAPPLAKETSVGINPPIAKAIRLLCGDCTKLLASTFFLRLKAMIANWFSFSQKTN